MSARADVVRIDPTGRLRGSLRPPADKSISHRAALLGAMSHDPVRIVNYLDAQDTRSTLDAVRALGAIVEERPPDARTGGIDLTVRGPGLRHAAALQGPLDVGNAGTLMRLLPGWLAAQEGRTYTLDGDESIRRRPVDRIAVPLELMGARVRAREGRLPPVTIHGERLFAIDYEMAQASAQVKSCVLLAALAADGVTTVSEPAPSRDHTERMLLAAGVPVTREGCAVSVTNCDELVLGRVNVPADLSSAAFAIVAAMIVPHSRLLVENVGVNWTRTGLLRVAERMGAIVVGELEHHDAPLTAAEPTSDLDIASSPLAGTTVDAGEVALTIDELPLVALLGCYAEGETVVRGAAELRVKESDRIAAVVDGLRGIGATIEALEDGFVVTGTGGLRGGSIDARGDHRIAMVAAVAGMASRMGVEVAGMDAASVSYPRFLHDMSALAA